MTNWTKKDEKMLRDEIKQRFRERTPPRTIDEVLRDYRVGRGEMRRWVDETLPGKKMPEEDREWMLKQAKWYRRMAIKAEKEKGKG